MTTFQEPRFGDFGAPQAAEQPRRTSIAAVMSLILGILALITCCFPGVPPVVGGLGLIFAVFAFVFLAKSEGRLGGRGLAVAGMLCSIIGILLNIGLLIGASQYLGTFHRYGAFMEIAHSDDQSGMSTMLSPATAQAITPEQIAAFKATTIEKLGTYQRTTPGLMAFGKALMKHGEIQAQLPQKYQSKMGGPAIIPLAAEFEKGRGILLLVLDPQGQGPGVPLGSIDNIAVVPDGGAPIWLVDPTGTTPPTLPPPPPPGTP